MYFIVLFSILAVCSCSHIVEDPSTQKPWPGPFANHKLGELVRDTPEVAKAKEEHARFFQEALANLPELPPEERYIPGPYEIAQEVAQQQISEGRKQANQPFLSQHTQQFQQPQYQAPQQQYQAPQQQYQAPQQQYQAPQQQYEASQQQYQAPQQQYQAPEEQYQAPEEQYQKPEEQYQRVEDRYQQPEQQYDQPQQWQGHQQLPLNEQPGQSEYQTHYQGGPNPDYWNEQYVQAPKRLLSEDIPRSPLGETPEVALARKAHLEAVAAARARTQASS